MIILFMRAALPPPIKLMKLYLPKSTEYTSTSKFPHKERESIKSIVAALMIKRIADSDIIKVIFDRTGKTITDRYLRTIRQQIKRESYQWYEAMREGEYEYIHEFKERINEILSLQKLHHQIIDSPTEPTTVKHISLKSLCWICYI